MNSLDSVIFFSLGSGYDSVGRAVASNIRGSRIEFNHWQTFIIKMAGKGTLKTLLTFKLMTYLLARLN